MKFLTKELAQQFLVEINKFDCVEAADRTYEASPEFIQEFIKGRESIVPKLKSFRKSQATASSWRKNRYKYMKGIRGFHKSTEGKRFHRSLGRYLSSRIIKRSGRYDRSTEEKFESLKGISSLRTHLYIDTTYYKPLNDQVEFDLFLDEAVIATINEEKRLYEGKDEFDERDIDILCRAAVTEDLIQEYCSLSGIEYKPEYLTNFHELEMLEDKGYIEILQECVQLDQ